jgi:hypothetical protein
MLWPVVQHVAALAQGGEVGARIAGRIMIEMGAGQHDAGGARETRDVAVRLAYPPPPTIAPVQPRAIPPAPIAEMHDTRAVRPSAMLTFAPCPAKADRVAQFTPVNWIEPAMLRGDRHTRF